VPKEKPRETPKSVGKDMLTPPIHTRDVKCFKCCSRRLTKVVFMRGLSSRARAPSFYSVREYLKRSEQRGALAAVCTPKIKSASEKHQKVTHLRIGTP